MNSMVLVRMDDHEQLRHGGRRVIRSFTLYVNGVDVEEFSDDDSAHGYHSGKYLDDYIKEWVAPWETALKCQCMRGEFKNRVKLEGRR